MKTRNRIALFSDDPDWHARRLTGALEKRGAQVVGLSFAQCAFETRSGGGGLCLPGFEDTLPDGVFVRLIDSGSMEQITLRLGLLHGLRELGVPVYNDARAIENTVDKSMASFLLNR
ncbi:MAG TPA: RimK family alpha-L-glutamate ligase, partial [Rhodospirillaceae bacterium]|nr:RimK family alpha-L-glutamate ligase [Rhodospirillaceae bacterium]